MSRKKRKKQAYANTLRFTDNNGKQRAIMPVFPNQPRWVELEFEAEGYSRQTEIIELGLTEHFEMSGTNLEAELHFKSLGYDVETVRDVAYTGGGNVNCMVNIIT